MKTVKNKKLLEVFFKDNLISIIPIFFVGLIIIAITFNVLVIKAMDEEHQKTEHLANELNHYLNNGISTLKQMETVIAFYHTSESDFQSKTALILESLNSNKGIFYHIEILSNSGKVISTLPSSSVDPGQNRIDTDYFTYAQKNSRYLSNGSVYWSPEESAAVVLISSGEYIFIGFIDVKSAYSKISESIKSEENTRSIAMISESGSLLNLAGNHAFTNHDQESWHEKIHEILEGRSHGAFIRKSGIVSILTAAKLESINHTLISACDPDHVFHSVTPLILILVLVLFFIVLYLAIICTWRSLNIKGTIDSFIHQTELVSKGEMEQPMENQSIHEFNLLTQNFNFMIDSVKQRDMKLETMAYHDRLTGIENRAYLYEKLNLRTYKAGAKQMALIYIDIDNFKNINDTFGHFFGDKLLMNTASMLRSCLDYKYKLLHLGGNEFVYLVPANDEKQIIQSIQYIKTLFLNPIKCCDRNIYISVSMGISICPNQGYDFDILLKCAHTALHAAKSQGKNTFAFYHSSMNRTIERRMEIEQHLRGVPDNEELHILFQPQIDLQENKVRGFEALLRWNSKTLGSVDPAEFISVAEDTGMIVPIGEWVTRKACIQIGSLNKTFGTHYTVAINLSPIELRNPDYIRTTKEILEDTGFDPGWLELEITENVFIHHNDSMISDTLRQLRKLGIKIALDDFGTGYSSLSYLSKLPIHTLKIDREFISNFSDHKTRNMIESIVIMAHKLDLSVIAEGVEKEEEYLLLKNLNCDFIQGYYFSEPIPFEEIKKGFQYNLLETCFQG